MKGTHWLDNLLHSLWILNLHILACVRRIIIQETHQHGLRMDTAEEHVRIVVRTTFFSNNESLESPERPDDLASCLEIV